MAAVGKEQTEEENAATVAVEKAFLQQQFLQQAHFLSSPQLSLVYPTSGVRNDKGLHVI